MSERKSVEVRNLEEEILQLRDMNRMFRRSLFHLVRQHGGQMSVKHHDLVCYYEVDEVLHWHYDSYEHSTVFTAKPLPKPPSLYGKRKVSWLRDLFGVYRIIFGEVWRSFRERLEIWRGRT